MQRIDWDARLPAGIARAGAADAGEVLTLQLAAWVREAHENATLAIPPLHDSLPDVQGQLADPAWAVWVYRESGRLLATVRTRLRADDPSVALLGRLGVVPDLHRRGLGGAMLRWAQARLPASVRRIELVTGIRSYGNHAFYARHGYGIVREDTEVGIVHLAKDVPAPGPVIVRAATVDDLAAIREVGQVTWPATYGFAGDEYVARGLARWWSDDALRRSLADTTMLVATVAGQVVGVGNLDVRGDVPVIWKLYVLPAWHAAGVGSALLGALLDRRPPGAGSVQLEYLDGNERAARFYARHGFTELRREAAERDDWPDWVWVERHVRA